MTSGSAKTIFWVGTHSSALIFIANVVLTIAKARQRSLIQYMLAAGVTFLALLYLIGIPFFKNLNTDYYWWWVIHLWVEGAWELITASLVAFVILKATGVERKVVEKWLYVETGLFLFTGLVGTGHHYYWIGAPDYWLWWGGFFSALPQFKGIKRYKETLGQWGFWNMCLSMFFLCLIFLIAGVLQTYLERFLDIGYMTAHSVMMFWFKIALGIGVWFLAGVVMTVWHLFTLKPEPEKA